MHLSRLIFMMLGMIVIISSCQSVKEGLSGQRKVTTEEFLVKKKNPLVFPPHFGELPKPINNEEINNQEDEIDLTKIFKKSDEEKTTDSSDTSLEKSILKKIGNN